MTDVDAHCLTSVGHCGYFCNASVICDGWIRSDISLYSFWIRVPEPSVDFTSSNANKCSNACKKNQKLKTGISVFIGKIYAQHVKRLLKGFVKPRFLPAIVAIRVNVKYWLTKTDVLYRSNYIKYKWGHRRCLCLLTTS